MKAVGFKPSDDGNLLVFEGEVDDAVLLNAIEQLAPYSD